MSGPETAAGRRLLVWAKRMDGMVGRRVGTEGMGAAIVVAESVPAIEAEARAAAVAEVLKAFDIWQHRHEYPMDGDEARRIVRDLLDSEPK